MTPLAFVVAVAAATLVVLIVAAVVLVRQMKDMASSMVTFRREVEPVLLEIQRDAERVARRLEQLQAERAAREEAARRGEEAAGPEPRVVPVDPDAPQLPG